MKRKVTFSRRRSKQ